MKIFWGIILLILGIIIILVGDRRLGIKEGTLLKIFSFLSSGPMFGFSIKLIKWVFGILLIWFGLAFIFNF